MKVILLKEVDNLGEAGDVVTVKNGYGRNFLIPQGMARLANKSSVKALEEERRQAARKRMQAKDDAINLAKELEKTDVVVHAKVGEENRIFGSVTPQQVALDLATKGFMLDRRKITLNEEIRLIGVYSATIKLHTDVEATVKVRVEPETMSDL